MSLEHGWHNRPCDGEIVSGDMVVVRELAGGLFAAVVDVLGHGRDAHDEARHIETFLSEHASPDLAGLLAALHVELKGRRGAAVGLTFVEEESLRLSFAGIGNVAARRLGAREERLVSKDGTIGQAMPTPLVWTLEFEDRDVFVVHTDGVNSRFTEAEYPQICSTPADAIAREVVRRFGKDHDDATCLALRVAS